MLSPVGATSAFAQVSHQDWGLTLSGGPLLETGFKPFAVGPALAFSANYGLHPIWNLGGEFLVSTPIPTKGPGGPWLTTGAFVGVSTTFDVLSVVPWLRLSAGTLLEHLADDERRNRLVFNPAVMASLGVDIRKTRDHAWGAQADVIAAARPHWQWARYVRIAVRYTWMRSRSGI